MSAVADALVALKNVVLMQERLDVLQRRVDRMGDDLKALSDLASGIDKRVIRIETMIEMSRGGAMPQIET